MSLCLPPLGATFWPKGELRTIKSKRWLSILNRNVPTETIYHELRQTNNNLFATCLLLNRPISQLLNSLHPLLLSIHTSSTATVARVASPVRRHCGLAIPARDQRRSQIQSTIDLSRPTQNVAPTSFTNPKFLPSKRIMTVLPRHFQIMFPLPMMMSKVRLPPP